MIDSFSGFSRSLTSPAESAEAILPSDTATLDNVTRGVYVGTGGDLMVEMLSGQQVLIRNAQAGALYPLRIIRVLQTGTTASDIVGMH